MGGYPVLVEARQLVYNREQEAGEASGGGPSHSATNNPGEGHTDLPGATDH